MPLTSLTPTAAVKIGSTTVCFFEFFQFFCTVICFGKFLVDSFCQSKDLKNVNSDKLICINDTYRETVLLNSVQEFAEIEAWLFLTFFLSLHNQVISIHSIATY